MSQLFGLDLLGLAQYGRTAVQAFPKGFAIGCFANTFGDPIKPLERIVASGKCPLVRVQLLWSDTHSFGEKDLPRAIAEAKRFEKLAVKYPEVQFELSPYCEHNITKLSNLALPFKMIHNAAPSTRIVNCPYKGMIVEGCKNEVHGSHAAPKGRYNYSYDGTSSVDSDVTADKKKHKNAEVFFFWIPQFNGRKNATDSTPRPERKAWPSKELIESVAFLATDRGRVKLPEKYLIKTHSDQHVVPPAPRELKPVLLAPLKVDKFLVMAGDKKIGEFPYYGKYDADGRSRYYLGQWGYKLSEKAMELTGKPTAQLVANDQVIGTVNLAFRAGSFR